MVVVAANGMFPSMKKGNALFQTRHWLIKFAPFRTPWSLIVRAGKFNLRDVGSPENRNHLAAMRVSDRVLFYRRATPDNLCLWR
jgi:predicted RNA-binding protein with PUA-like domain